jgi:hypothetical protein
MIVTRGFGQRRAGAIVAFGLGAAIAATPAPPPVPISGSGGGAFGVVTRRDAEARVHHVEVPALDTAIAPKAIVYAMLEVETLHAPASGVPLASQVLVMPNDIEGELSLSGGVSALWLPPPWLLEG